MSTSPGGLTCLGAKVKDVPVIANGVSERFRPASPAIIRLVRDRYGLRGRYVLSVGARQARKNLDGLVATFERVRERAPDLQLVLAGPTQWTRGNVLADVERLKSAGALVMLDYVPDDDLPTLYSGATVFAFPSLYEGFGLPVLEAMACGTPVVCSNATSLPEVAGDAAVMIDPRDRVVLADALLGVLGDSGMQESLRRRGIERARGFTWSRTARETIDIYRRVLAECGDDGHFGRHSVVDLGPW